MQKNKTYNVWIVEDDLMFKESLEDLMNVYNEFNLVHSVDSVEKAIQGSLTGDLAVFNELVEVLENPFKEQPKFEAYKKPPQPEEVVKETFCGT